MGFYSLHCTSIAWAVYILRGYYIGLAHNASLMYIMFLIDKKHVPFMHVSMVLCIEVILSMCDVLTHIFSLFPNIIGSGRLGYFKAISQDTWFCFSKLVTPHPRTRPLCSSY